MAEDSFCINTTAEVFEVMLGKLYYGPHVTIHTRTT